MNGHVVVLLYRIHLGRNKKEWNIDTHRNINESYNNYIEWKHPDNNNRKSMYNVISL